MTNRERARTLYKNTNGSDSYEESDIPMIEQALNDAEKRGAARLIEERDEALKWKEAYRKVAILEHSSECKNVSCVDAEAKRIFEEGK